MDKTWVKVLRWIGYGLFFVLALVLFVRFTFPTDQAKAFVKSKLAHALGAQRVELAHIGLRGLVPSGATIEGLEIELAPVMIKTPERGKDILGPPRILSAEEFSGSVGLMGLMSQNYNAEFEGKVQGGDITGGRFVWEKGGPLTAEIEEMKGVELGTEGLFQSLTGMDIIATLNGKLKVEIPSADKDGKQVLQMDQLSADIALELAGAKILQPIIDTVMSGEQMRMTFTDTKLGTITIKVKSDGGGPAAGDTKGGKRATVISIDEFSAVGGDIEVALAPKATITIGAGQTLKEAIINVHLAVKIADAWFDIETKDLKNPDKMTKPNVGLRTMLTLGPLKAHVVDGQFGVGITGILGKPKVVPERPRTRVGAGPGGGGGGRKMNVDHPEGEDEGEDLDRPAPTPKPSRSESRSRPVATPPLGGNAERPAKAPIVRPAVMGKAAPTNFNGRVKPNMMGGIDPATMEAHEPELEAPLDAPVVEPEPGGEEPLPEGN